MKILLMNILLRKYIYKTNLLELDLTCDIVATNQDGSVEAI